MAFTDPWDDLPVGNFVKWETPGTVVVGEIVSKTIGKTLNGDPCPQLSLRTDEGEDLTVTASQAALAGAVRAARPNVGDRIRIEFTGTEKREGGKTLKLFKVDVKAGTPKVSAAAEDF